MTTHFLILVFSTVIFRIITVNLFFVAFSACVHFYRQFYTLREKILQTVVNIQVPLYKYVMPKNKKWHYTKSQLLQFPDGTLGKDVALFLEKNQFDFIPFLEMHDVYHVLLNYKTTISDEARLYFFLLGNGKYSFEVLGTVAAGLILLPELLFDFEKQYRRGKNCARVVNRKFQNDMHIPTEVLRAQIFGV